LAFEVLKVEKNLKPRFLKPNCPGANGHNIDRTSATSSRKTQSLSQLLNATQDILRLVVVISKIDAASIVCGAGYMQRSGVRPSVCLSRRSTAAATCGVFAAEVGRVQRISTDSCQRMQRIYRLSIDICMLRLRLASH